MQKLRCYPVPVLVGAVIVLWTSDWIWPNLDQRLAESTSVPQIVLWLIIAAILFLSIGWARVRMIRANKTTDCDSSDGSVPQRLVNSIGLLFLFITFAAALLFLESLAFQGKIAASVVEATHWVAFGLSVVYLAHLYWKRHR